MSALGNGNKIAFKHEYHGVYSGHIVFLFLERIFLHVSHWLSAGSYSLYSPFPLVSLVVKLLHLCV